jgi:hypothetical protein
MSVRRSIEIPTNASLRTGPCHDSASRSSTARALAPASACDHTMSRVAATTMPMSRPTASQRLSSRFHSSTLKTAMARNMSVPSRRMVRSRDTTGATSAADPRTSVRFAVLDPTTLPSAISISPRPAARPDTSISGADVPRPMTSAPMRMGDNPRAADTCAAATTNRSAARVSSTSPTMRKTTERTIDGGSYRCIGSDLPPTG